MGEETVKRGQDALADAPAIERVVGYDLARSVALLGMIVVHFSVVAAADRAGPAWLAGILALLDGRAAATFVILAGVGLTMLSRRAVVSGDAAALADVRKTLVRRAAFLLVIGFINLTIWPGDILRVYGISLLLASRLLLASDRQLLALAAAFAFVFAVMVVVGDFGKNWDWQTLTYRNLWTPAGVLRNLFYDGFRSVLPWTGFVLFGMWLGRLDLTDRQTNRRVLVAAVAVAVAAEAASRLLVSHFLAHPQTGLDAETVKALFGTESMPALPLFLLAAGGAASGVIALSVRVTASWPSRVWHPLTVTGQIGADVVLRPHRPRVGHARRARGRRYKATAGVGGLWHTVFRRGGIRFVGLERHFSPRPDGVGDAKSRGLMTDGGQERRTKRCTRSRRSRHF